MRAVEPILDDDENIVTTPGTVWRVAGPMIYIPPIEVCCNCSYAVVFMNSQPCKPTFRPCQVTDLSVFACFGSGGVAFGCARAHIVCHTLQVEVLAVHRALDLRPEAGGGVYVLDARSGRVRIERTVGYALTERESLFEKVA